MFNLKTQIEKHQELFNTANESWENSDTREELLDELVNNKQDIANLIEPIFSCELIAEAISGENGDFIMITYWSNRIMRNVILKQYSIEELADFDSMLDLLKDVEEDAKIDKVI